MRTAGWMSPFIEVNTSLTGLVSFCMVGGFNRSEDIRGRCAESEAEDAIFPGSTSRRDSGGISMLGVGSLVLQGRDKT